MVGASIAKSLAYALRIPSIGVHHLESHLMAAQLEEQAPAYPFVALLVSGGHTMLIHVRGFGDYDVLGESVDDAVGEAFDKTAKLLGLPYPGGSALAQLAEQGDPKRFDFPRPMINRRDLNFSFSGLKTHAMQCIKAQDDDPQTRADIACAFQEAVVATLTHKCVRALQKTNLNTLVLVGGVAANQRLRAALTQAIEGQVYYPRPEFCTDNGAMVAYNGWLHLAAGEREGSAIQVKARWPLSF